MPNDIQISEENIKLTDLLDVEMLQRVQDAFAKMTGLAVITVDADGIPVTKGSNFCSFCSLYNRNSPLGAFRCQSCDASGAKLALEAGKPVSYTCHAGLVEFAAPILANDTMIGYFVGGQVRTAPPNVASILQAAREIGVDAIAYLQSALNVPTISQEEIDRAAAFLYTIADVISSITYHRYIMHKANVEIERTAQLKSDFLANMSHEIRTPMNAVIGMAEMALREEMSPAARDYIQQIKTSGKSLLTIINDILDFSKIESGKMDIIPANYAPCDLISDISNVISTRIGEKNIEFLLDINPTLPCQLYGDNIRIKQVITNISNNAIKFTEKGQVVLKMDYESLSADEIMLKVSVADTGIGIHKKDIEKLFESFQQLDSKRNRNVEGTGLGLPISRKLLTLMGGDMEIESEYGSGSTFSFYLPQKVVNSAACVNLTTDTSSIKAAYLITNPYLKAQLERDFARLGINSLEYSKKCDMNSLDKDKPNFVFVGSALIPKKVHEYAAKHPDITFVHMIAYHEAAESDLDNLIILKKPVMPRTLAAIFNHEYQENEDSGKTESTLFDFSAPDAQVLIVDDNPVNLTVAKGLIEPLNMQVDTALDAHAALECIEQKMYDVIFMDHMMPEIDGIEATHLIRSFHPNYASVPIIAFSANAVEGTKQMFLEEGMNDFVGKPVEVGELVSKLKQWLPSEKILPASGTPKKQKKATASQELPHIEGLDVQAAVQMLGDAEFYMEILKDYYQLIDQKTSVIMESLQSEDWNRYTIEVHALKSSSKQIGAMELSGIAAELEAAGKNLDLKYIHDNNELLISKYHLLQDTLKKILPAKETKNAKASKSNADTIPKNLLLSSFAQIEDAISNLDTDALEAILGQLGDYHYPAKQEKLLIKLKEAVDGFDFEACEIYLAEWKTLANTN
ncbi:MAG: response regulator [Lachnospiraceae bacterium]|nr:response regulator [Lachnospiraceae bacterium]